MFVSREMEPKSHSLFGQVLSDSKFALLRQIHQSEIFRHAIKEGDEYVSTERPSFELFERKALTFESPAARAAGRVSTGLKVHEKSEEAKSGDVHFHLESELHPPVFSVEESACILSCSPFARSTDVRTPGEIKTPRRALYPLSAMQSNMSHCEIRPECNMPVTCFSHRSDKTLVCKQLQIADLTRQLEEERSWRIMLSDELHQMKERSHEIECRFTAETQRLQEEEKIQSAQLQDAFAALNDYRLGQELATACSTDTEKQVHAEKEALQARCDSQQELIDSLTRTIKDLKASLCQAGQQTLELSNQVRHPSVRNASFRCVKCPVVSSVHFTWVCCRWKATSSIFN